MEELKKRAQDRADDDRRELNRHGLRPSYDHSLEPDYHERQRQRERGIDMEPDF